MPEIDIANLGRFQLCSGGRPRIGKPQVPEGSMPGSKAEMKVVPSRSVIQAELERKPATAMIEVDRVSQVLLSLIHI